jgi:hypothetical protein
MVVRKRKIALGVELAFDGISAMFPGRKVRSLGHCEDAKLRPKLKRELGLQPLDAASEVPDAEESPRIDGAAVKGIISIDVRQTD